MPDVRHFDPDQVLDAVVRLFWRRGAAVTGIRDVVAATGLSRSSLYATFGDKRALHLAALRRYVEHQSRPALTRLAAGSGLDVIAGFFDGLIEARCSGPHARWGCMVANTHLGADDPDVRDILAEHHDHLRSAMRAALAFARLRPGVDPDTTAEHLALLAHGVNLRSRAGADAAALREAVRAALDVLRPPDTTEESHG